MTDNIVPREPHGTRMTYGNFEFSPVPFIQVDRTIDLSGKEEIGATITINVSGTILGPKHLQDANNYNIGKWGLDVVETQRQQMEQALSVPGEEFKISCIPTPTQQNPNPQPITYFRCYPNLVGNVSFQNSPDNWTTTIPYSFQMAIHQSNIDGMSGMRCYLESMDENLSIEFIDEKMYPDIGDLEFATIARGNRVMRLTRTLSATGKKVYGEYFGDMTSGSPNHLATQYSPGSRAPHEHAKDWVLYRLSQLVDDELDDEVFNFGAFNNGRYNHTRQRSSNEITGTFSVTESWLIIVGSESALNGTTDDYSVSFRKDVSTGINTVSVEGTIQGYQSGNIDNPGEAPTKIVLAQTLFGRLVSDNIPYRRARLFLSQLIIGDDPDGGDGGALQVVRCLNPIPINQSVRKQLTEGVISYTFEYDTRQKNIFNDTLSESFSYQMVYPNDVFSTVTIPGRQRGPIFFSANTITEPKFTLNYELVLKPRCLTVQEEQQGWQEKIRQGIRRGMLEERSRIIDIAREYYDYLINVLGQDIVKIESDNDTWDQVQNRYSGSITFVLGTCNGTPFRSLTQMFES